jgi:nickel-dependent lactate racemase
MTEILEIAIEKAKVLSSGRQDDVGKMVLAMIEQDSSQLTLSAEQQNEVRRRLEEPINLVPDAEMNAFFRKLAG